MNKKTISYLLLSIFLIFYSLAQADSYDYVNKIGIKFVGIDEGFFEMGSPKTEQSRNRDEKLHTVKVSKRFYISITEITQGQWYDVMRYNPSAFPDCGAECPVDSVSWYDCLEFLKKLNRMESTNRYRLPTEAEWEYACRAGSKTAFTNGDIIAVFCEQDSNLDKIGWYCGNSGMTDPAYNLKPLPVAQKKPNAWGIYDMHGNVSEWCLDACEWRNLLTGKIEVITKTYIDFIVDPVSLKGSRRIFRGGSWSSSARNCRSAKRAYYRPSVKRNNLGFRIIMDFSR